MTTRFEIPTLHTSRLTLRALRAGDLDAFAAMHADPEVRRFLTGGQPLSREATWGVMAAALGQWALRGYGMFAITLEGRLTGWAGVAHPLDWPEPELAYALARAFWGRGIAAEALIAARDWAFTTIGLRRLASFVAADNRRSIRVVERLGAVKIGAIELRGVMAEHWVHWQPGRGPVV